MLKQKFAYKPISIVLDNARYQHCFVVKTMARSLGIHLQFLPPYSPNLNIIERLRKVTIFFYARYYENPKKYHEAVQTFFNTLTENYKPELMSLFSLKFQFFDKKDSQIYPL